MTEATLESGPSRAAILLMAIGEENAASVLQFMAPEEVQAVGEVMSEMGSVSQEQISSTLDSFLKKIETESSLGTESNEYLRRMLERGLGEERAIGVLSQLSSNSIVPSLDALKWMPARVIASIVSNEHPQFIAIVLSYLDKDLAASVLALLPDEIKSNIVLRIARLDTIQPNALQEIDAIIEISIQKNFAIDLVSAGGVKKVAEILNGIPAEQEDRILSDLTDIDNELANQVKDSLFVFENLLELDDRGFQLLLREISGDVLINALKGATEELRDKVFRNMSSRAASMMQDDLAAKGPLRLTEVEEAQKSILATASQLIEDGKLQLGGKGGEFV